MGYLWTQGRYLILEDQAVDPEEPRTICSDTLLWNVSFLLLFPFFHSLFPRHTATLLLLCYGTGTTLGKSLICRRPFRDPRKALQIAKAPHRTHSPF